MSDIQTAIDLIRSSLNERQRYIDYYDGRHPRAFATEKWTTAFGDTLRSVRDNLCPIITDALADRLEVINFAGDSSGMRDAIADAAWALWQRERMEILSFDTHVEALKCGAAYVIVWSDHENNARFYLQDSRQCVMVTDDDTGDPIYAAKQWMTPDERTRLNLYYADRIERYITQRKNAADRLKDTAFVPLQRQNGNGETIEDAITPNPFGVIPMFAFYARPALADAIPIQDALNKTIADKLVAMEFAAYPQRWATGLEPPMNELTGTQELPFKAGVDRLWFTGDAGTRFGEFGTANLEQFLHVATAYREEMAVISGTPLHFFGARTSDAMSGEALKTLESRFTKKATRLQISFGAVWARAMKLALGIEGQTPPDNLTAQWTPAEQRSEKELLESLILKQELGVPNEVLLEEYGYTPEDIAKFDVDEDQPTPDTPIDPNVRMAREQMNGR